MSLRIAKNLSKERKRKDSAKEKEERLRYWSDDSLDKYKEQGRS